MALASAGPYANLHLDPDTTTPASYHSVFYRPGALPTAQPTASKHCQLSKISTAIKGFLSLTGWHIQLQLKLISTEACRFHNNILNMSLTDAVEC